MQPVDQNLIKLKDALTKLEDLIKVKTIIKNLEDYEELDRKFWEEREEKQKKDITAKGTLKITPVFDDNEDKRKAAEAINTNMFTISKALLDLKDLANKPIVIKAEERGELINRINKINDLVGHMKEAIKTLQTNRSIDVTEDFTILPKFREPSQSRLAAIGKSLSNLGRIFKRSPRGSRNLLAGQADQTQSSSRSSVSPPPIDRSTKPRRTTDLPKSTVFSKYQFSKEALNNKRFIKLNDMIEDYLEYRNLFEKMLTDTKITKEDKSHVFSKNLEKLETLKKELFQIYNDIHPSLPQNKQFKKDMEKCRQMLVVIDKYDRKSMKNERSYFGYQAPQKPGKIPLTFSSPKSASESIIGREINAFREEILAGAYTFGYTGKPHENLEKWFVLYLKKFQGVINQELTQDIQFKIDTLNAEFELLKRHPTEQNAKKFRVQLELFTNPKQFDSQPKNDKQAHAFQNICKFLIDKLDEHWKVVINQDSTIQPLEAPPPLPKTPVPTYKPK